MEGDKRFSCNPTGEYQEKIPSHSHNCAGTALKHQHRLTPEGIPPLVPLPSLTPQEHHLSSPAWIKRLPRPTAWA